MTDPFIRDQFFTSSAGSPRRCESFDSGWKFLRGDACDAHRPDFDDSAWRVLDLPHDWSLEDLPEPPHDPLQLSITRGRWLFQKGDDLAWKEPACDDAAWQPVDLPDYWEAHSNYNEDNVYGWFRRRITIPTELRGKDFMLAVGKVDDVDETFFNGHKIGGLGTFPPDYASAYLEPRIYRVPREFVNEDGENVVAVRVFDGPYYGGIYDEIHGAHIGPFDTEVTGGGQGAGYVVGGIGWYRKSFQLAEENRGRLIALYVDGVYMNADMWINGFHLGKHAYGYTAFAYELTRHLHFDGQPNVIAVRLDNFGRNTRWYSGSGIYRHTWLIQTNPVHIPQWGVSITTPEVTDERATVRLAVSVLNADAVAHDFTLTNNVLDPQEQTAGEAVSHIHLEAGQRREFVQEVIITDPLRWGPDTPHLYSAHTTVAIEGDIADGLRTPFGIRGISFDAQHGFLLNGVPTKLKGGCMHHDNGPLGAAALDRAEVRRVELMKANGFNAIRSSHNPPSQVFLDACDSLGMLVLDEAFDAWRESPIAEDYHLHFDEWWQRDLESMVLRDRNHPSVILWSIGNEIPEQRTADGYRTAWMLADAVRKLDSTRPVTIAGCGDTFLPWERVEGCYAAVDVCGYNYAVPQIAIDHQRYPERIFVTTESVAEEVFDYWMAVLDHPYLIGDFVWTGFDYIGESGLGQAYLEGDLHLCNFPWHLANCGDLDIRGQKRAQSYYRDVVWDCGSKLHSAVHAPIPEGRIAKTSQWGWPAMQASWSWPGSEQQPLQVDVYSRCEEVTLLLNGREIATQPTSRATKFMATFSVPYEPGELRAIGRNGGVIKAEHILHTAGTPHHLRLFADRAEINTDRNDLAYITCEVLDQEGQLVPYAANLLHFFVEGVGELAGQANGNPRDAVSYRKPERHAYQGSCLLIIRPMGKAGSVQVRAESEGLVAGVMEIVVKSSGDLENRY